MKQEIIEVNKDIIGEIHEKKSIWYGHASRMGEVRQPKKILEQIHMGRWKRGWPVVGKKS